MSTEFKKFSVFNNYISNENKVSYRREESLSEFVNLLLINNKITLILPVNINIMFNMPLKLKKYKKGVDKPV